MLTCTNFKSLQRGTLQGFADLVSEKMGLEFKGCSLHMKEGRRWVNLPQREYKDQEGQTQYSNAVRFVELEHYKAWQEQAKSAIDAYCAAPQQPAQHVEETPF